MSVLANLPKIELHCHLDGILNRTIVQTMQGMGTGPQLPGSYLENIPEVRNAGDFWAWCEYTGSGFDGPLANFFPIMECHIANLISADVVYAEIMVQGSAMGKDEIGLIDMFQEFRDFIESVAQGRIQIELLIALGRGHPPEHIALRAKSVVRLFEAGLICGIALAGPELGNPVKPLSQIFRCLKDTGMGIEIHAGEWAGAESVWDAIEYGFPDRIGHGIAAFDDPKLLELIREQDIHLEFCPTSNIVLTHLNSIDEHPVRLARDMGLSFSINTDDPGPLNCSMNSEFDLLRQRLDFTDADFATIFQKSREAAFCRNFEADM